MRVGSLLVHLKKKIEIYANESDQKGGSGMGKQLLAATTRLY